MEKREPMRPRVFSGEGDREYFVPIARDLAGMAGMGLSWRRIFRCFLLAVLLVGGWSVYSWLQGAVEVLETLPSLGTISGAQVQKVLRERVPRLQRQLARFVTEDPSLAGTLELALVVAPNGRVTRVRLLTPHPKGAPIEGALERAVRQWRFPVFIGPPQELRIPIVLRSPG